MRTLTLAAVFYPLASYFPIQPVWKSHSKEPQEQCLEKELPEAGSFSVQFNRPDRHFFDLPEQIAEIEKWMSVNALSEGDQFYIRQRISHVLSFGSYSDQMSELGMILFYLDRDKRLPESCYPLLSCRALEMIEKIECGDENHFLLKELSCMVFTSSQAYNRGGLIAIRKLLEEPGYLLSKYLMPEHREHILIVTDQILGHSAFDRLFKKVIRVYPELQKAIRIDLKMNSGDEVTSVHAFYACMMALFSDVRQMRDPVCYATSVLVYIYENHPYLYLTTLIGWLEQGHHISGQTPPIPISYLWEKRASQTDKLCDKTGINSALIYMQLAILEFAYLNFAARPPSAHPCAKEEFMKGCFDGINKHLDPSIADKEFSECFQQKVGQKLWLENCYENGGIRDLFSFKGDPKQLSSVLANSSKVFYLKSGRCFPIETISQLQEVLDEIIQETLLTLGDRYMAVAREVTLRVRSNQFRKSIALSAEKQIGKGMRSKHLDWADLLVLEHKGGKEGIVLDLVYNISLSEQMVKDCQMPYQFLQKLFGVIQTLDIGLLKKTPKILIANPGEHVWTLAPSRWQMLFDLNQEQDLLCFVEQQVFNPAKTRMAQRIPQGIVDAVIERATTNVKTRWQMKELFNQENPRTYKTFSTWLLSYTPAQQIEQTKKIIDEEYSKLALSQKELATILTELHITYSVEMLNILYREIGFKLAFSYQLARELRLALIAKQISICDPYEIELAICRAKKFPIPFNIGDLNWFEFSHKTPSHFHLVIGYSWANDVLCYYVRNEHRHFVHKRSKHHSFHIQYPKTLSK